MSMRSLIFIGCIFSSTIAFANKISREPQQVGGDVGMRDIEIEDITMVKAIVGTSMAFKGSDASNLHVSLPKLVLPVNPEEATGFIARDQAHAVVVKCIKNQFNSVHNTYEPVPNGPLCTVTLKTSPDRKSPSAMKWTIQ